MDEAAAPSGHGQSRGAEQAWTKPRRARSGATYVGEQTEGGFKAFSVSGLRRVYAVFAIASRRQGWKAGWESQRCLMEEIFRGKRHMASEIKRTYSVVNLHLKNIQDRLVHLPSRSPPRSLLSKDAGAAANAGALPCRRLPGPAPSQPRASSRPRGSSPAAAEARGCRPLRPRPGDGGLARGREGAGRAMGWRAPQSAAVAWADVPPSRWLHRSVVRLEPNAAAAHRGKVGGSPPCSPSRGRGS